MIALDTNLLVYAYLEATPEHLAAQKAIDEAVQNGAGWGIALPTVTEFWCVVTHPQCPGGPSQPSPARLFLANLVGDGGGRIWEPGPDFGARLLQTATDLKICGPRVFD